MEKEKRKQMEERIKWLEKRIEETDYDTKDLEPLLKKYKILETAFRHETMLQRRLGIEEALDLAEERHNTNMEAAILQAGELLDEIREQKKEITKLKEGNRRLSEMNRNVNHTLNMRLGEMNVQKSHITRLTEEKKELKKEIERIKKKFVSECNKLTAHIRELEQKG